MTLSNRLSTIGRDILATVFDIHLRRISLAMAIRNTMGIGIPILLCILFHHPELAIFTGDRGV